MEYVALLRAVNVGPHGQVSMADLQALLTKLGFPGARTLLRSGNLVFEGRGRQGAALEGLLERGTEQHLKVRTDYFVRTATEWRELVARNPFRNEAKDDPSHLVVMFMKAAPAAAGVRALQNAIKGPEIVKAAGKQAYIVYPAGIGRSKLTAATIENKLGSRGTGRNWNTVLKLLALTQA